MSSVVVWGAGGHGRVAADILLQNGVEVTGFVVDTTGGPETEPVTGLPILGGRDWLLSHLRDADMRVHIAIGDNPARLRLGQWARENGLGVAPCIASSAHVSPNAQLGYGCFVGPQAAVNAGARIGDFTIVNTSASVDHDCVLGEGVHLSPGCHLGGGVTVGRATWLGLGASVRDHVQIGADSILGAGSLLLKNLPDGVVAYGHPAKVIRPT